MSFKGLATSINNHTTHSPNKCNTYNSNVCSNKSEKEPFQIIFLMGVSGSGKTTIGKSLSLALSIPFFDGDDYHSKSNILKMSKGQALNDKDRFEWLKTLNNLAKEQIDKNSCIIACSSLKKIYRDILDKGIENNTKWVLLHGYFKTLKERIDKRSNHYMKSDLLASQFEILEQPEDAILIDIKLSIEAASNEIINKLTLRENNEKQK